MIGEISPQFSRPTLPAVKTPAALLTVNEDPEPTLLAFVSVLGLLLLIDEQNERRCLTSFPPRS